MSPQVPRASCGHPLDKPMFGVSERRKWGDYTQNTRSGAMVDGQNHSYSPLNDRPLTLSQKDCKMMKSPSLKKFTQTPSAYVAYSKCLPLALGLFKAVRRIIRITRQTLKLLFGPLQHRQERGGGKKRNREKKREKIEKMCI